MADPAALIAESWEQITAMGDRFPLLFYGALAGQSESAERLFMGLDHPAQRRKLMAMLARLVTASTADRPTVARRLAQLGADHRRYGVEDVDGGYALVGEALLFTMSHTVRGWTDQHRMAWAEAYWMAADAMAAGGVRAAAGGVPATLPVEVISTGGVLERAEIWVEVPGDWPPGYAPEMGCPFYVSRAGWPRRWVSAAIGDVAPPWRVRLDVPVTDDDLDSIVVAFVPPEAQLLLAPHFEEASDE
jgi:hemoglobin-like flavoprotein